MNQIFSSLDEKFKREILITKLIPQKMVTAFRTIQLNAEPH